MTAARAILCKSFFINRIEIRYFPAMLRIICLKNEKKLTFYFACSL